MRIHAIDASGSFYIYAQKAFCALRHYAKDDDFIVMWDAKVGKLRRWADVKAEGHKALTAYPWKPTAKQTIFDWMEGRFMSHHDTLVVYSDFCDEIQTEDTFYRTEFVCFSYLPGQKFFNSNIYRVGDHDEGYRVLPWPDHPALSYN